MTWSRRVAGIWESLRRSVWSSVLALSSFSVRCSESVLCGGTPIGAESSLWTAGSGLSRSAASGRSVASSRTAGFPFLERQLELGRERDLELDGDAGVLLGPEPGEEFRDPLPEGEQPVDLGVAGGAETHK